MTPDFDIFRVFGGNDVMWEGTTATLEEAYKIVSTLMALRPADFIILNHRTGERTYVSKTVDAIQ